MDVRKYVCSMTNKNLQKKKKNTKNSRPLSNCISPLPTKGRLATFNFQTSLSPPSAYKKKQQQQKQKQKELWNKTNYTMYVAGRIFQLFRADGKAETVAQWAKQDAEDFKEAVADSTTKSAKTENVSFGEGLHRLDLLLNSFLCLRIKYIQIKQNWNWWSQFNQRREKFKS